MTFRELESRLKAVFGAGAKRHLLAAYTPAYLKRARDQNTKRVPAERIDKILASINQHEKELKALKKELSSLL
jgi:hypothetical protein